MSFTCYACHQRLDCEYHIPPLYDVTSPTVEAVAFGAHRLELDWAPDMGVSWGLCEDCGRNTACVNCAAPRSSGHAENYWEIAEQYHPGCCAQWDAQNGPEWLGDHECVVHVTERSLTIGYGHAPDACWALWSPAHKQWLFLGNSDVMGRRGTSYDGSLFRRRT